jgi:hypothetical protein
LKIDNRKNCEYTKIYCGKWDSILEQELGRKPFYLVLFFKTRYEFGLNLPGFQKRLRYWLLKKKSSRGYGLGLSRCNT